MTPCLSCAKGPDVHTIPSDNPSMSSKIFDRLPMNTNLRLVPQGASVMLDNIVGVTIMPAPIDNVNDHDYQLLDAT